MFRRSENVTIMYDTTISHPAVRSVDLPFQTGGELKFHFLGIKRFSYNISWGHYQQNLALER
jgi:hypothetical protein